MYKKWQVKLLVVLLLNSILINFACAQDILLTTNNYKKVWGTIKPGDRVIFADGEYRAEFYLNGGKPWSAALPTIFMAENPGKVVIKGSDIVQGWQSVKGGQYVKDWPTEAQQVFVKGNPLKQLGGSVFDGFPNNPLSTYQKLHQENGGIWPGRIKYEPSQKMPNDSFYYDQTSKKLFIQTNLDLEKNKVEVSVRWRPFFAEQVKGIVLDGLVFEHSNTSYRGRGAVISIIGDDNVIKNVKVKYADDVGIGMVGNSNKLIDSEVTYSGRLGVGGSGEHNLIKGITVSYNNTRGFNKWWEAGGFKFVGNGGLQNSEFIGNTAIGNKGDGIWFDWQNKNNLIQGNVSAYNSGFGIHYELSQLGVIQDNYVYGNGQRGIFLRDSANCTVTNNMVIANGLEGIAIIYTGQKDNNDIEFGAENTNVYSNIVGWNDGGALIMPKGSSKLGDANNNVYLGSQKSNKFSLGYPSIISPAVYSLSDWNKVTNLDTNSLSADMPMPKEIADAVIKKTLITNWLAVQNAALSLRKEKDGSSENNIQLGDQAEAVGPRKIK